MGRTATLACIAVLGCLAVTGVALAVSGNGGRGHDRLVGTRASDKLNGFGGPDLLIGGRGADLLIGGRGRDVLRGGPGRDGFNMRRGVALHARGPDRIEARDGGPDEINCGGGRDVAIVDTSEDGVYDCEVVRAR